MHTLASYSKSDINTVIDYKRYLVVLTDLVELLGSGDEDAGVTGLVSVLYHRHTCERTG